MKTTLISIDFSRTTPGSDSTAHVEYTFKKSTPMGAIVTRMAITNTKFSRKGAEVCDGEAFFQLGAEANREELNRLLEMGAASSFGSEDAA
jgi:hypothetical protein